MSTVMYNYRLAKRSVWDVLPEIRKYYLEHWPYLRAFNNAAARLEGSKGARELLRKIDEDESRQDWYAELQLFDAGSSYIIRPIEKGYFFLNNYERWPKLKPVFLDTRTDDEDEATLHERRRVAEWTNEQIKLRRYFIYLLVSRTDYADAAYWSIRRMVG